MRLSYQQPGHLTMLSSLTGLRRLALHCVTTLPSISLSRITSLLLLYAHCSSQRSLPLLGGCSRLKQLHLRVSMGQGSLMVSADRLPTRRVCIMHSRLSGHVWLHADLGMHSVRAVTLDAGHFYKFP